MGALLIYLLKTGLLLLFFYLFNRLILANETFHKFNRIVWLLVLPVSLLLPLCVFGSFDLFGWLGQGEKDVQALVIPEGMTYSVMETEDNETSALARFVTWTGIVYFLGILVCLICYAVCYLKLFILLRKGGRNNKAEPFRALLSECNQLVGVKRKVRLIVHSKEMAPFSWMRYIMVSEKDMTEDGREILIHELSHIRHGHSMDLILMDLLIVFQWFNPAVWLMKQSVQQVHEFQADDSVLRAGVNAKQYQLLLIKKAVGTRRYSMVNSFNHSKLKKRITMMWKKKSSK
ncbi:MAG: M56 family metallopeptidase, partial [Bacteroidales bacterium]|nr:M56 family metallopeptidase [Bacteroidales bacterium]MDD4501342.1 M56 family metallopeptidase [Bacteroidales bacterium]